FTDQADVTSSLAEKDKLMFMAQAIKTVLTLSNRGAKNTSDSDEESLISSSSSESPDSDIPRKRKRGHKKETKSASRSKSAKHSSRALIFLQQQPQTMY
uniref:Uncharacterized protein n=1 Tax=Cyprinus carpio TaxID=7962 RepID=A0A8C1LB17_CYPCA